MADSLDEKSPTKSMLEALLSVKRQLEVWNYNHSPSESDSLVEQVPVGHPLHSAVVALERHYPGAHLPNPALHHWRNFLKFARRDDEMAEHEADSLLMWVKVEIEAYNGVSATTRDEHAARGGQDKNANAPPDTSRSGDDFRDQVLESLTVKQVALVQHLWDRNHGVNWDSLPPEAFRAAENRTDAAIQKTLERIQGRLLEKFPGAGIELQISPAKRRVKLIRPRGERRQSDDN